MTNTDFRHNDPLHSSSAHEETLSIVSVTARMPFCGFYLKTMMKIGLTVHLDFNSAISCDDKEGGKGECVWGMC